MITTSVNIKRCHLITSGVYKTIDYALDGIIGRTASPHIPNTYYINYTRNNCTTYH